MKKQYFGAWTVVGAVGGLSLLGVAACGQGFGEDCKASHTCAEPGVGEAGAAVSGGGSTQPEPTVEGGSASAAAGEAPSAGAPSEPTSGGAAESMGGATDATGAAGAAGSVAQPGNEPPTVTSVSPADKAKKADPDANIVITFSEPLNVATVTADNIKILDGASEVAGKLVYADGKVTFTPDVPLFMLEGYKVSVSTAVTDVEGASLVNAYTSSFTTRDGAWTTIDAVEGSNTEVSDSLPISADGRALLAWDSMSSAGCPASARWFRLAEGNGAAQSFDATDTDCRGVTAGGNALGVGSVAWSVPDVSHGELAQQFRAGAWQAKPAIVSSTTNLGQFRVGVSPTGMVTLIAQNPAGGTTAFRTDASGKWVAQGDKLSTAKPLGAASIAFDSSGNGLAVWLAATGASGDGILSSRYTTASGKWSAATAVPIATHFLLGNPALAMSADGDAVAAWAENDGDGINNVNTSIFSRVSGWSATTFSVSGYLDTPQTQAPAIAFDGQGFVVAWVGQWENTSAVCLNAYCTYTNRYDLKLAKWGAIDTRQTAAADIAAARMPLLASDGRGNLMLVWAKPAGSSTFTLAYQRYVAGKWSAIAAVQDATITDKNFVTGGVRSPLSMNASGMAAIAWANYDSGGLITTIRLASFF